MKCLTDNLIRRIRIKDEWTQKKYTRVEKIPVLALVFSKLLNHNYRSNPVGIYMFKVNFEHISPLVLVFLLLTLRR